MSDRDKLRSLKISSLDGRTIRGIYEPDLETGVNGGTRIVECQDCGFFNDDLLVSKDLSSSHGTVKCGFCMGNNTLIKSFDDESLGSRSQYLMFLIDTSSDPSDLGTLVTHLINSLDKLKTLENCKIAIVSMDGCGNVIVHSTLSTKSNYIFTISNSKIERNLKTLDINYFMKHMPDDINEIWKEPSDTFINILKSLQSSYEKTARDKKRCKRATGLSQFICSTICVKFKIKNPIILNFLTGPCTKGAGKVLSRDKKEHIRQFHNLNKNPKLFNESYNFYKKLREMFPSFIYEYFMSSLDQVGVLEQSPLLYRPSSLYQFNNYSESRFKECWDWYLQMRQSYSITDVKITVKVTSGIALKSLNYVLQSEDRKPLMNYGYVVNYNCLSLPFELSLLNSNKYVTDYIQFQLQFYQKGRRNVRIHSLPINSDFRMKSVNNYRLDVDIPWLAKSLAYNNLTSNNFKSPEVNQLKTMINRYTKVIYSNVKGSKVEPLEYLYNLERSILLLTRNVTPDERTIFSHLILYSKSMVSLSVCKPKVVSFRDGKQILMSITQETFNQNLSSCIDGGDFIAVRYSSENEEDTTMARSYATTLRQRNIGYLIPLYIDTIIGKSQDRYLKSKLLPLNNQSTTVLNTEDMSFEQFVNNLKSTKGKTK
ncbi:hypothetical protein Kpol_1004p72 [Vanderwaltozyma polyspora DSM 70294]|uniref:Protein transport protein SEC23 n=1 Tax=Vanderwaltozyma polyspora (strain ATCC 22028 / DSM 70294 / BCRC 21397 / CBS 2163 / NBRC 10782 / NRRL Y-8283 / UCD 57-17) TaxID=436907 RepID=A7TJC5_VANPO|nr:uncharacterized protein Kpol_1004p72 [Vanderwaltozyma polyspora DSM 70294]EDO17694.1 hypothetical protein Kpol_1004p72 [Vanderwaltozyma polyspora DSM 70294]